MPLTRKVYENSLGETIAMYEMDNRIYPLFMVEEWLMTVSQTKMRDDDIMVIAYGKSGTHWIHEIVRMVLAQTAEIQPGSKRDMMLDTRSPKEISDAPSPRVMNTHLLQKDLPVDIFNTKIKHIFLLRNPKDLVTSHYYHCLNFLNYEFTGTFAGFLEFFMDGKVGWSSLFEFLHAWEKTYDENPNIPVLVLNYEDIKEDTPKVVCQLAKFLDVPMSVDLSEAIGKSAGFKEIKKSKDGTLIPHGLFQFKDTDNAIFRKGIVGDWKNQFTVAQNEEFEAWVSKNMENSKLKFKYEINE